MGHDRHDYRVNGEPAVTGRPGSYAVIEREWRTGDRLDFTLPVGFRVSRYEGADQVIGA